MSEAYDTEPAPGEVIPAASTQAEAHALWVELVLALLQRPDSEIRQT